MAEVAVGNGVAGSGGSAPKGGFLLGLMSWWLLGHPWEPEWGRGWAQWEMGCSGHTLLPPLHSPWGCCPQTLAELKAPGLHFPGVLSRLHPAVRPAPPLTPLCPQAAGGPGGQGPLPG